MIGAVVHFRRRARREESEATDHSGRLGTNEISQILGTNEIAALEF
jgi:hypothetical protein